MLDLVDLTDHADKKPSQISGGQKQRVAIARALVNKPDVLLLDEPLAALDLKLRQRLLVELDAIHDEVGITFIYVTHDQGEAMSISDRIAVMNKGRIEQTGSPAEIYEAPAYLVRRRLHRRHQLPRRPRRRDRSTSDSPAPTSPDSARSSSTTTSRCAPATASTCRCGRKKSSSPASNRPPGRSTTRVPGNVEDVIYFGSHTRYWVRCGECRLCAEQQHRTFLLDETPPTWGDQVWLRWHANDGFLFDQYRDEDEDLLTLPDEEA